MSSALRQQGGPSPLWNGARRFYGPEPGRHDNVVYVWQVRTGSGAFDGSEATPLSGGSVPDEHLILIGIRGGLKGSTHHLG